VRTLSIAEDELRALVSANAGVPGHTSCNCCPAKHKCPLLFADAKSLTHDAFTRSCRDTQLKHFGLEVG
jgi:hypothetical protein